MWRKIGWSPSSQIRKPAVGSFCRSSEQPHTQPTSAGALGYLQHKEAIDGSLDQPTLPRRCLPPHPTSTVWQQRRGRAWVVLSFVMQARANLRWKGVAINNYNRTTGTNRSQPWTSEMYDHLGGGQWVYKEQHWRPSISSHPHYNCIHSTINRPIYPGGRGEERIQSKSETKV